MLPLYSKICNKSQICILALKMCNIFLLLMCPVSTIFQLKNNVNKQIYIVNINLLYFNRSNCFFLEMFVWIKIGFDWHSKYWSWLVYKLVNDFRFNYLVDLKINQPSNLYWSYFVTRWLTTKLFESLLNMTNKHLF